MPLDFVMVIGWVSGVNYLGGWLMPEFFIAVFRL